MLNAKPEGRIKRGRPKLRREAGMDNYVKAQEEINWEQSGRIF
jgi:hypothetical protein